MALSVANAEIVRDSTGSPPRSVAAKPSTIACRIDGTPGSTKTLPMREAGRDADRVVDQRGPFRHFGHLHPRLG